MNKDARMQNRSLKNVAEAGQTRQKRAKKRSLRAVNEHFETAFNAVWPTQVVFQRPVNRIVSQLCLSASLLAASAAWAADAPKNFGLDVKITAQSEDDRDLGTREGGDVKIGRAHV